MTDRTSTAYEQVESTVTEGIQDYFHQKGKPEVLNRIGKNLIVFNFIQPDAAKEIMRSQINKICGKIKETQTIEIELSENVWEKIEKKVLENLEEGGRGVGNVVEEYFITPLSNYVFDNHIEKGSVVRITDISETDGMFLMLIVRQEKIKKLSICISLTQKTAIQRKNLLEQWLSVGKKELRR